MNCKQITGHNDARDLERPRRAGCSGATLRALPPCNAQFAARNCEVSHFLNAGAIQFYSLLVISVTFACFILFARIAERQNSATKLPPQSATRTV